MADEQEKESLEYLMRASFPYPITHEKLLDLFKYLAHNVPCKINGCVSQHENIGMSHKDSKIHLYGEVPINLGSISWSGLIALADFSSVQVRAEVFSKDDRLFESLRFETIPGYEIWDKQPPDYLASIKKAYDWIEKYFSGK